MKTLIAYGTRFGATAGTSKEISKILTEQGHEVKIVDVLEEKIKNISPYDLVIVASGIKMDQWIPEAEGLLKKFQKELAQKKFAIFVSSAMQALYKAEGNPERIDASWKNYLVDKAAKYSLQPLALGLFGGVINYESLGFYDRSIVFDSFRKRFEEAGIKETASRFYDTRDWDEIRLWAKVVAAKGQH
jgi:menaquinone-dependent protoporphyrinogen IX oxidase